MAPQDSKMNPNNIKEFRTLGIRLFVGFPVIGLFWTFILKFFGESNQEYNWLIFYCFTIVGVTLGLLSWISSKTGFLVYKLWNRMVVIIDCVIVWTSLPIFYYLIFCPYSLMIKIFGKSEIKKELKKKTYWVNVKKNQDPKSYIRQF
jgi:hypothetical protein